MHDAEIDNDVAKSIDYLKNCPSNLIDPEMLTKQIEISSKN